jgi:hypothetical protein
MPKRSRSADPNGKPIRIPVHGDIDHNAGIYLAIGSLIVHWANNESVFLAMLQTLIGGDGRAAGNIIWYSQRTTKARLDLFLRLCRAQVNDDALLREINQAARQFRGLTKVRNLYCHALYEYDEELRLRRLMSITVADNGEPLRPEEKFFNRATLNELADAINKLAALNRNLWGLVQRLASALGAQHVRVPPLPPASS